MSVTWLLLASAFLGFAHLSSAQGLGVLEGTVVSYEDGEPISGAVVSIEDGPTGSTNEQGRYRLIVPNPGAYEVSAYHSGWSQTFLGVIVSTRRSTLLNFGLDVHSYQLQICWWEPPLMSTSPYTSVFFYPQEPDLCSGSSTTGVSGFGEIFRK